MGEIKNAKTLTHFLILSRSNRFSFLQVETTKLTSELNYTLSDCVVDNLQWRQLFEKVCQPSGVRWA